ncbi:hypothetical protein C2845_PM03G20780 [Panicum miliaceum]|uniref:Uncharacterized protein n=1 Tax=Panicum miliaceum TaxID=4540 RepID=A0A3L6T785_PANMI|nr:hypothetical protein C2845_PM03G20780 [Panicum miliaceum]
MDNGKDESGNSDDGDEDGQPPAENTMTGLNTVGGGVNKDGDQLVTADGDTRIQRGGINETNAGNSLEERLAALTGWKRGCPPGAKKKVKSVEAGEKAQEADHRKESTTSRRRGRPPGAKNKVQPVTTLQDEVEPETDRPRRRRLIHLANLDD